MGSFIPISKPNLNSKSNDFLANNSNGVPQAAFIEFIPAKVTSTIINEFSPKYDGDHTINGITVEKLAGPEGLSESMTNAVYLPLLRGVQDLPVEGDIVLIWEWPIKSPYLKYYIGPISGKGNSPNFSDLLLSKPKNYTVGTNKNHKNKNRTISDSHGIPKNFKKGFISRLQKPYDIKLDDPTQSKIGEAGSISRYHTHGDMVFEGRYGNSLRLGSRNTSPLLWLSNGRRKGIPFENYFDTSTILMTTRGKLSDHLGRFVLGSDDVDDNPRKVSSGNINSKTEDTNTLFDYKYGEGEEGFEENGVDMSTRPVIKPQMLFQSERIVFNSKKNDLVLSAFNNIDIGAGNNLTINTKNYTSIESSNIYLGKKAVLGEGDEKQPMVLGSWLIDYLKRLIMELAEMRYTCQGVPTNVHNKEMGYIKTTLQGFIDELDSPKFISEFHYIEDNGTIKFQEEEISGCTDPSATNYNQDANIDDESCEYSST